MRPRSMGATATTPLGASLRRKASKAGACAAWMSKKKKLGACLGTEPPISARRLRSTPTKAVSRVTPRPSEIRKEGVNAPGRWRLATARRKDKFLEWGARRAQAMIARATP